MYSYRHLYKIKNNYHFLISPQSVHLEDMHREFINYCVLLYSVLNTIKMNDVKIKLTLSI